MANSALPPEQPALPPEQPALPAEQGAPQPGAQRLHHGALGAADSIVMAVAGSAPAYSIAATTAILAAAIATGAGPGSLLWCGIPMIGIAFAFSYLGKADVNAGASYSWVRKALHPSLGFMAGWSVVVSATIFMVAAALPAGQYTLSLFNANKTWSANTTIAVGALWFLVMAVIVAAGVSITTRAQWIMSSVEVVILVVVGVMALVNTGVHHGSPFSWHWFSPTNVHGLSGFAAGALVAAFYYWGWDVTANLGEEQKHSRLAALGGIFGVVIVFALFELFTVDAQLVYTQSQIQSQSSTLLGNMAAAAGGGFIGKCAVVAVMLSTIATLETTLIQVSRSLFAMGRDNTLPRAFGRIDARRKTPLIATVAVAVVSLVLFALSNHLNSVGTIMTDAIDAIGIQIAVYYSLAAIAVLVAFRGDIFKNVKNLVCIGLLPLLGAAFMLFTLIENLAGSGLDAETKWIGVGALAIGLIPLAWYWTKGVPYYTRGARLESETDIEQAAIAGVEVSADVLAVGGPGPTLEAAGA